MDFTDPKAVAALNSFISVFMAFLTLGSFIANAWLQATRIPRVDQAKLEAERDRQERADLEADYKRRTEECERLQKKLNALELERATWEAKEWRLAQLEAEREPMLKELALLRKTLKEM